MLTPDLFENQLIRINHLLIKYLPGPGDIIFLITVNKNNFSQLFAVWIFTQYAWF